MSTAELVPFEYRGSQVRTVLIDGEPWWVAADVCSILGYSRVADALRMLDEDDLGTHSVRGEDGRDRPAQIVSEPGLYNLILRSKRDEAKAFRRWITREVLPAIRRTGRYEVAPTAPARLPTSRELAQLVIREADRADAAEALVAELEGPAHSWEQLEQATGDYSVREAAQLLDRDPEICTGQNRLFAYLYQIEWIDRTSRPYQAQIEAGRLATRVQTYEHPQSGETVIAKPQVRVTVKGLHELHKQLGGTRPLRLADLSLISGDAS